jgi:hypothetical protein
VLMDIVPRAAPTGNAVNDFMPRFSGS